MEEGKGKGISEQIRMGAKLCTAICGVDELMQHGVAHDQVTIYEKCARDLSRAVRPGTVECNSISRTIDLIY